MLVRIYDNSATEISSLVQDGTIAFGITLVAAHRWDFDIELLMKDPFPPRLPRGSPARHADGSELVGPYGRAADPNQPADGEPDYHPRRAGEPQEALSWRFEVQHIQTAVALVRAGVALTVIPSLAFDTVDERGLKLIPLRNPSVTRQLGIISKRGTPLSPLADELRKLIVQTFAEPRPKRVSPRTAMKKIIKAHK